jgi:hypothetical protein
MLDDFIEGRLRPYKLYIFLNAIRLDGTRRSALKKELKRDGRVAVWIYAPGYIDDVPSLEGMQDLTGFRFGKNDHPWPSHLSITEFSHPATADLSQDLFWSSDSRLGPQFYVDDPDAQVLGQSVFAQGTCKPGYTVKEFPDWTSIYIAVPNIPSSVLRGIARYTGVHLYGDRGDVLYATRDLLGVHTVSGGKRTFRLPREVSVVYDLFEKDVVAQETDTFEVELKPASTSLYYTGKAIPLKSQK